MYKSSYNNLQDMANRIVENARQQNSKVVTPNIKARRGLMAGLERSRNNMEASLEDTKSEQEILAEYMANLTPEGFPEGYVETIQASDATPRPVSRGQGVGNDIGRRLLGDLQEVFGLTREQAAGFVGNLAHETGDFKFLQEIEPLVPGSRGGYGFAQWTGPRRENFEAWSKENNLDPSSYEANLGFLVHEINNTPEGRFLGELRGAETAEEAARIVSEGYLRPGIPNMESRYLRTSAYLER